MRKRIAAFLTFFGMDMTAWEASGSTEELSEAHVAKMESVQKEHTDLTAEVAQLKADKATAAEALVTANADKDIAETALSNATITAEAVAGALALEVAEGTTLSGFISEIGTIAGAQPGAAEHSESVSDGDNMDEDAEAHSKFAHNQGADEVLGK